MSDETRTLTVIVPAWAVPVSIAATIGGFLGILLYQAIPEVVYLVMYAFIAFAATWTPAAWRARQLDAKARELMDELPREIHVQVTGDGDRVAVVTRMNGNVETLTLPDGYDPINDGGEALLRAIILDAAIEVDEP